MTPMFCPLPKVLAAVLGSGLATVLPRLVQAAVDGDPAALAFDGDTILLRKYRADGCCDLCGEVTGDSILFRGKRICAACRKELAKL